MGTLIKVNGADYSANSIGKFDFDIDVFRKKRQDGTFEKNVFYGYLQKTAIALNHGIDLFDGVNEIEFDIRFKHGARSGIKTLFSFAYGNFKIIANINEDNKGLQINLYDYTTGRSLYNVIAPSIISGATLGVSRVSSSDNYLSVILEPTPTGYLKYDFKEVKANSIIDLDKGTQSPLTPTTTADMIGICTSLHAGGSDVNASLAMPWFFGIKKAGRYILHFDFLGDSETEILTDKVNGVVLERQGFSATEQSFREAL